MPAFDPVRDAVLNSPIEHTHGPLFPRRATDLAVLLNADDPQLTVDDPQLTVDVPRPIPYNPCTRITPPASVLQPLTPAEIQTFKSYRGKGAARLLKRKRASSNEPESPPSKRHAGDVGVVVDHCSYAFWDMHTFLILHTDNSRPDVGVVQRQESPIIGLKNFNNWVKSILISRFAHPALLKSTHVQARAKGKVLDMGCGKGGDITKWSKAKIRELLAVGVCVAHRRLVFTAHPDNRHSCCFCRSSTRSMVESERNKIRCHICCSWLLFWATISSISSRKTCPAIRCCFHAVLYALCLWIDTESSMHARQCDALSSSRWYLYRHGTQFGLSSVRCFLSQRLVCPDCLGSNWTVCRLINKIYLSATTFTPFNLTIV